MYSCSRQENNELQHWRLVCIIWKTKYCRKTGSPFLLKRKTKKSDGLGSSQWSEVLFSIFLSNLLNVTPYMWSGPGASPSFPSWNWPQPGVHSPRKEHDCCHLVTKAIICAEGQYFQSFLSAYALHLIIYVKNMFGITVLVPVTWKILKTQLNKNPKLLNVYNTYIPK